jgi:hypothetical protein
MTFWLLFDNGVKIFPEYETAKSWAITNVSIKGEKWAIYDSYTGNVFWSEA